MFVAFSFIHLFGPHRISTFNTSRCAIIAHKLNSMDLDNDYVSMCMSLSECVCVCMLRQFRRKSTSFRSINNSCRLNHIYHGLVMYPNSVKTCARMNSPTWIYFLSSILCCCCFFIPSFFYGWFFFGCSNWMNWRRRRKKSMRHKKTIPNPYILIILIWVSLGLCDTCLHTVYNAMTFLCKMLWSNKLTHTANSH